MPARGQDARRQADDFILRIAKDPDEGRVDGQDALILVRDDEAFLGAFECLFIQTQDFVIPVPLQHDADDRGADLKQFAVEDAGRSVFEAGQGESADDLVLAGIDRHRPARAQIEIACQLAKTLPARVGERVADELRCLAVDDVAAGAGARAGSQVVELRLGLGRDAGRGIDVEELPGFVEQHDRSDRVGQQLFFQLADLFDDCHVVAPFGDRLQDVLLQTQDQLLLLAGQPAVLDTGRVAFIF